MREQFAIILGSGFGDLVETQPYECADSEFGQPSSALFTREFSGTDVRLLLRHGEKHDIPPHAINYRANIAALNSAGVSAIIALNTVGVVSRIAAGGQLAVPQQLIDYTWGREHTFATGGAAGVRHIEFTEPFTELLRIGLLRASVSAGVECVDGGVYAVTQGPRLETAAEVDRLERDGVDYVGMTAMPEAALAAELDIDYAMIALVVNRAAGRGDGSIHADVEVNSSTAKSAAMRVLDAFFRASR